MGSYTCHLTAFLSEKKAVTLNFLARWRMAHLVFTQQTSTTRDIWTVPKSFPGLDFKLAPAGRELEVLIKVLDNGDTNASIGSAPNRTSLRGSSNWPNGSYCFFTE